MLKIRLDKKQYETLVKLVYLGNWVVNSIREKQEDVIKEYDEMEQYIFSFYNHEDAGLEKQIEYNPEINKYYPTWELEKDSDAERYLQEYNDEIFWDELVDALSIRDTIREYGKDALQKMDWKERYEKRISFMEKYDNEFIKLGVERLEINENVSEARVVEGEKNEQS